MQVDCMVDVCQLRCSTVCWSLHCEKCVPPRSSYPEQLTLTAGTSSALQVPFPVEQLPSPEAEVRFLRYTFDPGAQLPSAPQVGSTLLVVESGEITLTTDQPERAKSGGRMVTPSPAQCDPDDTTLRPTEGALVANGTLMSMRNDIDREARLLVLLVFSGEQAGLMDEADGSPVAVPTGVNLPQISGGYATFPAWSGVLLIEREIVGTNRSAVSSTHNGIEAGELEQGSPCGSGRDSTGVDDRSLLW
jgi:hypothetical protein